MVSVIGDSGTPDDSPNYRAAYDIGRCLIESGFRVCSGGLTGIMSAVFAGAHSAHNYREGDTVGIIPTLDRTCANAHTDIVIATGIGHARNLIVANSDAVIVIGGGAGTLSEAAFAWTNNRLIVALTASGGIAEKIADSAIDHRARGDVAALQKVWGASTPDEAVALIKRHLPECQIPPPTFEFSS